MLSSSAVRSPCALLLLLVAMPTPAAIGSATSAQRAESDRRDGGERRQARDPRQARGHRLRRAVAPNTRITSGPKNASTRTTATATFRFKATKKARFRCSLDGSAYASCRSPMTRTGLSPGRHKFGVRAETSAGGADRTPATRSWRVAIAPAASCMRPYAATSPWNTPIADDVAHDPRSAAKVATLEPGTRKLTSDPTQYTFPVYYADASTPRVPVTYTDGWFSEVSANGSKLVNTRSIDPSKRVTTMPIPPGTTAAAGYDAQIIVIDTVTGEEWDASHFYRDATGYHAWNIGHYNTNWSGVPPLDAKGNPFWIRGPGIPYLTGLIRPCEIARGRIDHALAFAYPKTTTEFVYPATRSDGQHAPASGMAEGTRLQLDPTITKATIQGSWRCTGACFTIATALQRYGMYVADGGGRPKIMPEYEATARWNGTLTAGTPSAIPLSAFRVIAPPAR